MNTLATARPAYIQQQAVAAQEATAERALKQFQKEHKAEYWEARNKGERAMRIKRVIKGTRLVREFFQARPNPYLKGSFQYQAWESGYSNAIWEEQMGYDL